MWNIPTPATLEKIPRLYSTDSIHPSDKLLFIHFFIGGSDWYIAEYDGHDLFYGYAILNGDHINAEWGYISFTELKEISINGIEIDCEIDWQVKKASEIKKINMRK